MKAWRLAAVMGLFVAATTSCIGPGTIQESRPGTPAGKQRIVLFFDGTRNVARSGTNVHRLYEKVSKVATGRDGMPQTPVYLQGVGTRPSDFFTGAAFGRGISRDVRDGYEELRRLYRPGDEIWLFGFSRGAFTARSLAGFVAQYGILAPGASLDVQRLYDDYREIQQSRPIYYLRNLKPEQRSGFENVLVKESRDVRIRFTGVWDTVGTVGLPWGHIKRISASEVRFFELDPRAVYDECYQALAVDEERPHYRPILWKSFRPGGRPEKNSAWPAVPKIEQRWFVGAHSNVGGGYKKPSDLYKVSLKWMEDKAAASGLGIADRQKLRGDEHLAPINDSFGAFLPYRIAPWFDRQPRPIQRAPERKEAKATGKVGWVYTRNETVDETVYDRMKRGGSDGEPYVPRGRFQRGPATE